MHVHHTSILADNTETLFLPILYLFPSLSLSDWQCDPTNVFKEIDVKTGWIGFRRGVIGEPF